MLRKLKDKFLGRQNEKGQEIPDPTPIAIPAGITRPPTLQETIQRFIRNDAIRRHLETQGIETFEEADDFDVPDNLDPSSPYELVYDQDLGKEVYPHEKNMIDRERQIFDKFSQEKLKEAKKKKAANAAKQKKEEPTE